MARPLLQEGEKSGDIRLGCQRPSISKVPIPELIDGVLPVGMHDATLDEIVERFGGFMTTDRRVRLAAALRAYVQEARIGGLVTALIVDGSFITAKPDPGDIDLIAVLPEGHDYSAGLRPVDYNVIATRGVRQIFGLDAFAAPANGQALSELVAFFAQVKGDEGRSKGLLRLTL